MSEPKTCSGDQSYNHQAIFNVIACLQRVIPEVEGLRDLRAKTDREKQKRTELEMVSPHISPLMPFAFSARAQNAGCRSKILILRP